MNRDPRAVLVLLVAIFASSCATAADDKPAAPAAATAHKDVNADEFEKLAKAPDTVVLSVAVM